MQIAPENLDSYQNTLQDIWDQGGFTSQWQTVGSDRVLVSDDGSGIGINTETGETYPLEQEQVQQMVNAGLLNTDASGYTEAIGATPSAPAAPTTPTTPSAPSTPSTPSAPTTPTKSKTLDPLTVLSLLNMLQGKKKEDAFKYEVADVSQGQKSADELLREMFGV